MPGRRVASIAEDPDLEVFQDFDVQDPEEAPLKRRPWAADEDEHLKMLGDKPGESPRVFLNLARGFLVQPQDLLRAVQEGHVGYAMTDVFPQEPGRSGAAQWKNPFEGESRILATPHIGAATREAQPRIAKYVARTTELLSRYGMIRNCVFRPRASIQFEVPKQGCLVSVVHADKRGTKKAVDDAIYEAGANNLRSAHIDFPEYGVAYEVSALDREDQVPARGESAALDGSAGAVWRKLTGFTLCDAASAALKSSAVSTLRGAAATRATSAAARSSLSMRLESCGAWVRV